MVPNEATFVKPQFGHGATSKAAQATADDGNDNGNDNDHGGQDGQDHGG
jgi:hypothetical protein